MATKKQIPKKATAKPTNKKVIKKAGVKSASKKPPAKKAIATKKKAATKKPVAKKVIKKEIAKKVIKKAIAKKVIKKAVPKKTIKKAVPKKTLKNVVTKRLTKPPVKQVKKKTVAKKGTDNVSATKPSVVPVSPNVADTSTLPPMPVLSSAAPDFIVSGNNPAAPFALKVYRGEGMALVAMNWTNGKPPDNFVGFGIESREPGGAQFFPVSNRISFQNNDGSVNTAIKSSLLSPIQKFRWVHFPFHPDLPGLFTYRVTSVFMDANGVLTYGEKQEASIQLASETYPGVMNVGFTRGFIASQAFVSHFGQNGGVGTIIPKNGDDGMEFVPTDPKAPEALDWMGFEARRIMLTVLDEALGDPSAQVRVLAYDLNLPEIVDRCVKLGTRLKIIIDDSGKKADADSPETKAAKLLIASAGAANVQRQHMGGLQHSKTFAVKGDKVNVAIGGSTNMSWRGLFVQNNNVVLMRGPVPAQIYFDQFENSFNNPNNPVGFGKTPSADWNDLKLSGVNAKISFSPHSTTNAILGSIAEDISSTTSSLFYSLAFLYQTKGVIKDAIEKVTGKDIFVYGISDKKVGGLDIQSPNGNPPATFPATLMKNVPEPFLTESSGGNGIRLHHKFVVIDFNKPTARVYTGSYNFSTAADRKNNENLLMIQDQRVAVSYMIEGVTIFDHYEFRNAIANSPVKKIFLKTPPKGPGELPWWDKFYTNPEIARDRALFA